MRFSLLFYCWVKFQEEADKLAELEGRLKVLQESEVQANADEKAAKDALNEEETHKKQLLTVLNKQK